MTLRSVPIAAGWFAFPWHLRGDAPVHGGRCCYCDREIAIPNEKRGWNVACIYCGLDRGELPLIEAEAYAIDAPLSLPGHRGYAVWPEAHKEGGKS